MKEVEEIKNLIFNSEIHQSIELAASLIRDINASDYYDLNVTDIERALIKKFDKTNGILVEFEGKTYDSALFVISEGYATGGHTRLMENLSQMIPSRPTLLVTRPTEQSVITRFERYFEQIITCFNNKNNVNYINRLAKEIVKYNKVILNIHPDDLHTVIACDIAKKLNKELQVYFVNHADHIATYGVTVSDIWYEISLSGHQLDKFRGILSETKISFLGIPINKPKSSFFEKVNYNYNPDGNRFLTAASSNKYELEDDATMIPLLDEILTMNSKNRVSIISSGIEFNPFFKKLKKEYPNRVRFHSSLPYDEYIKLSEDTDFYIDSYPMPGGTAFVEQFLHGKPCIGLQTKFYGYTPLELVKRNTAEEALELLTTTPSDSFLNELNSKIFEVHGFDKVKERFLSNLYDNILFKNPMNNYIDFRNISKKYNIYFSWDILKKILKFSKLNFINLILSKHFLRLILNKIKSF
ncbi:hypothetical protein [Psychrobacter glacincola]|uniref:Glycosyltransferase n=1 Tax=Psychrobacter glacincola TaxID=56810 RepID=A0ABW1W3V0_9GAMM|nr:hypothetical protein [Psychrobacter glacincola]